ncbi:MAG: hypothetical protein ACK5YR_15640, partial [Pirellula sp.]
LSHAHGIVALFVGWSLLTDFAAIKQAGVPIQRLLITQFRLKQQSLTQLIGIPAVLQSRSTPTCGTSCVPVRATDLHCECK